MLIIAFNGGLIILYVFAVSIAVHEVSVGKVSFILGAVIFFISVLILGDLREKNNLFVGLIYSLR